ncbi:Lrp/AsnC family transcriptional regulator [Halovivax gelatinilyticus]|uniref:Lrp/AsnC family transcriptional regulator n=1 Tax=Halovivax gelatinilyticus TaxID=2961597 RepID=UPI0020CA5C2D|nr:Lrp/AsnC family transcriptional regulator [Halovivax gelatinilyticus]
MSQDTLELDSVDRAILQLLQDDARNNTTTDIGDAVGVSHSTVSSRINDLEADGVITGYTVEIDFERIGVNPVLLLVCTAPARNRESVAAEAIEQDNVTDVRTVLSGERNLYVTVVAREVDELVDVVGRLEELEIDVVDSGLVKDTHQKPFTHFGEPAVDSNRE